MLVAAWKIAQGRSSVPSPYPINDESTPMPKNVLRLLVAEQCSPKDMFGNDVIRAFYDEVFNLMDEDHFYDTLTANEKSDMSGTRN